MRRPIKPWFRAFNQTWYVCLHRKQIPLAKGKDAVRDAELAFHRLMASENPRRCDSGSVLVMTVLDLFLNHFRKHAKPSASERVYGILKSFSNRCGRIPVPDLVPLHVFRWLDACDISMGSRSGAIASVKRAFNWAVDEGIIVENPIRDAHKPRMAHRKKPLTLAEQDSTNDNANDEAFRNLIRAVEALNDAVATLTTRTTVR